jgi:Outer membrane protein beta-barrel domain
MSSQKSRAQGGRYPLLATAVALYVMVGAVVADAQTVMVRNAPPGGTIELVVNAATAATATADPSGGATLSNNLQTTTGKAEIDANVYVDVCTDNTRRIVIVERGQPAAAQPAGCDRRDTGALFLIRRVSTLIVNVGGTVPTVVLRQGPVRLGPRRIRRPAKGLIVFGGVGRSTVRDTVAIACGNVAECSGEDSGLAYNGGVDFWLTRYVGVEASYFKPADVEVSGRESTFTFTSTLDAEFLTVSGKAGVPLGPVRLYGKFGTTYHRALFKTTQSTGDVTQTLELGTQGWGWVFGGGGEIWLAPAVALYAELGRAAMKGSGREGAEGTMDERVTFYVAGARIRILGR